MKAQDPVDCSGAIPVCNSQQLNYNSNGPGTDDFGPGPNNFSNGCLSGNEHQSAWFLIYISSSSPPNATLAFTITPSAGFGEDYDFAIWGPNVDCSALGLPIRCSWAAGSCGFCPETGLGMGTVDFSEGAGGDGFVAEIQTQPGQSYILLVDNYNSSSEGFFLDWTGTAILSCSCTTIPVITGDLEICAGETTVLTATGTNLNGYQWVASGGGSISGPANTASINAITQGTYTVTVTDTEGCTGTTSVIVTAAAGPIINFSITPATCGQSNGSIDLTISGGAGPYSFTWSTGNNTEDITGLPAGSYSVTVTNNNGCQSAMSIQIPDDSPALNISGIIEDNTSCSGGNGNIITSVFPLGTYTYIWSNGETTGDIFDLTPGTYFLTVTSGGSCTGTASFTIGDAPDMPEISSNSIPSLCELANGEIDVTVVGGVSPYVYSWSGGETTEDLSNLPAGNYSLTVTGDNSCSAVLNIVLTNNNPQIVVTANINPNTSCNDQNGAIFTTINPPVSPTGDPYTFSWSNGSSGQNLTDLAPGIYTLTVNGGGSCTQEVTFTVPDVPNIPMINAIIDAANCGQANGAIQTNTGGGVPPFTYLWSDGSINPVLNDLFAGSYSVTVTGDNGCTALANFVVPDEPINFIVNSIIEPNTSCSGDDNGSISVNVIPGGNYTYTWSTGENGTFITDLTAGSYTLTVSAGGTCEQQLVFIVPDALLLPAFNTVVIPSMCDEPNGGVTVIPTGGESPFTFLWSNGDDTQSIQNVLAGTYSITVTGANDCITTATVMITNEQIDIVINENITANTSCLAENGAIDLTISPPKGLTLQWSNGESTPDLNNLASGSYVLIVSAGGSCVEVFAFNVPDDITIPVINLTTISSTCGQANGSIDLTMSAGEAPFDYAWSNGEFVEDLTGLLQGTYTVTVTDALGCISFSGTTVNNNNIPLNISGFSEPNTSCDLPNGEISISIVPSGTYNYAWSNGDDIEDLTGLPPGNYTVTVTLGNQCNAAATFIVGNETSEPLVTAEITAAVCGEDNGSVDLTVSGSVSPYIFLWSTGETLEDIADLFPGNYTVTVTGSNDCYTILVVNVPNNSSNFSVSGNVLPLTSCAQGNGSVNLLIEPPGSYEFIWSNGETTEDIANLQPGNYSVTVTQSGSCAGSATFSIADSTSSPSYTATITYDQCNLAIGTIELIKMTGEGPFTFLWSNGESTANLDSLGSGNYTVTVTDSNACTTSSGYVMVSNSTDITIAGASLPNTLCANPNGSIDIIVTPAEPYTYLWSNGETTEDLSGIASGNYTVTVSLGSCIATATFNVGAGVSAISLSGSTSDVACNGGNDGAIDLQLAGGMPPYFFMWPPPISGSIEDPINLTAGQYTVTVTDQAGCSTTSSFTILEPESITLSCNQTASVSAPGLIDGKAGVQIAGGIPPYSITWTPGSSQTGVPTGTFNISNLGEGDYDVEVVDAKGCVTTCNFTITAEACTTALGSMDPKSNVMCGEGCISAVYDSSSQILNTGDIVQFILHEGAGNQIQNELARADQPQFCFIPAVMQFNVQYYISVVAGPNDGSGNVLLSGPCAKIASGTPVVFYEIPQASIDDPDQIDCDHPEIELSGNSSMSSSSFMWASKTGNILTDPTLETIRINTGGLYELIVTVNTCKDTAAVDVAQSDDYPTLITGPIGSLNCRDRIITLSGSTQQPDVELFWASIASGDTTILGSGDTLVVNAPGTYYLLAVAKNGCTSSMPLIVNEFISTPFVDAGEDRMLSCEQTSFDISSIASDGVEYLWMAPAGIQLPVNDVSSLHIDQPGVYVVMVTDTLSFCTATDSIEILQSQDLPVSIIVVDHVSCFGEDDGSIIVQPEQGQGPFMFFINGESYGGNNFFSSLSPGLFTIEVIDAGGCSWITNVEIEEPELLLVNLGADLSVHPGELITLELQTNILSDQVESIVWTPDQLEHCLNEPCTGIRFSLSQSAVIGVTVTDTNGCFASDILSVIVIHDLNVFGPNIFSPNGDGQNDVFTLFAGSGVRVIRRLSIFSRWGELLFERQNIFPNDVSAGWDGTHVGRQLDPGVFTWKAEIEYQNGFGELLYGDVTLIR